MSTKFFFIKKWWQDPDLNWGHKAFQASALPTELSRQIEKPKLNLRFFCQEKLKKFQK
jgi:hypothetical protein